MAYDTCNNTATFLVLPHECGFTGERKWHSVPPTVLNFAIRALLGFSNACSVELEFCCNCSSVFVFSFFHWIFANQVIPSLSGVWSQIGPEHVLEQEYCMTPSLSAGVTQGVEAVSSKASLVPALVYLTCVGQPVRSLIGTDASVLSVAAAATCASLEELQELGRKRCPSPAGPQRRAAAISSRSVHQQACPTAAALGRKLTSRSKVSVSLSRNILLALMRPWFACLSALLIQTSPRPAVSSRQKFEFFPSLLGSVKVCLHRISHCSSKTFFLLAKTTWMYILGGVEVSRSRRRGRSQLSVEAGCRYDLCLQVHHFNLPRENVWFRSCVSMLWVLFSLLAHLQVPSRSILLWVSRDLPWAAFLFLTRSPAGGCGEQEGKRGSATTERATGMHFTLQLVICSEANLQPGKLSKENVKEFFFKFNKVRFLEVCSHLRVFELSALQELVSHLHPSLSSFEVFRFRSHYVHLYLPNRKLIILCLSLIWF